MSNLGPKLLSKHMNTGRGREFRFTPEAKEEREGKYVDIMSINLKIYTDEP